MRYRKVIKKEVRRESVEEVNKDERGFREQVKRGKSKYKEEKFMKMWDWTLWYARNDKDEVGR